MRIFVTSDLHADFKENWRLLQQLSAVSYQDDTIIVAGDIADRLEVIERTLLLLRSTFRHVFYTPGNHELWVRTEPYDSIEKLRLVLELCNQLDVQIRPAKINDLWIVPLFSWYHSSFDLETSEDVSELAGWADFHLCRWPQGIGDLSQFFLEMNEANIKPYDAPVISFSHFLPRRELLPSREYLKFKSLPRVAGCVSLDDQIRKLNSVIHVFGHSHIDCDLDIEGVRYVQSALRYPRERKSLSFTLKAINDSSHVDPPQNALRNSGL
jgi:hypothetical protein